ncbi:MAG: C4-dicarboxylate ABC transporter substrate-binding protein, partial [Desulfobacterales bacterium]
MKNKLFTILIAICVLTLAFSGSVYAKERIIFGGGPAGGTFQVVANGIQVYKPVKAMEDISV